MAANGSGTGWADRQPDGHLLVGLDDVVDGEPHDPGDGLGVEENVESCHLTEQDHPEGAMSTNRL